jgi:hypothetical protein
LLAGPMVCFPCFFFLFPVLSTLARCP